MFYRPQLVPVIIFFPYVYNKIWGKYKKIKFSAIIFSSESFLHLSPEKYRFKFEKKRQKGVFFVGKGKILKNF